MILGRRQAVCAGTIGGSSDRRSFFLSRKSGKEEEEDGLFVSASALRAGVQPRETPASPGAPEVRGALDAKGVMITARRQLALRGVRRKHTLQRSNVAEYAESGGQNVHSSWKRVRRAAREVASEAANGDFGGTPGLRQ